MHVRKEFGPLFQPDVILIGNVTTLADPSVVDALLEERKKMDIEVG